LIMSDDEEHMAKECDLIGEHTTPSSAIAWCSITIAPSLQMFHFMFASCHRCQQFLHVIGFALETGGRA
jgi:hypothetical protein